MRHLLMERDHRLVSVRAWAAARRRRRMLEALRSVTLRDMDLIDDRLANALTKVSDPADQGAVDRALRADWIAVYTLPTRTVRLDGSVEVC